MPMPNTTPTLPPIRAIHHHSSASPGEITAATELARLLGPASVVRASSVPGPGVNVALASRGWIAPHVRLPTSAQANAAWMWLRIVGDGTGEIVATHGSFLFAAVRLLANNIAALTDLTREKLATGVFLPATFGWHSPHWDACYAQYWRSARGFDPEHYVATLAEAGFTHAEVNSLQAHMPYEDLVASE